MLRITIELVPFGVEDEKKVLSQFLIHNVGRRGDGQDMYKIAKSLSDKSTTFSHTRSDGLHTCVVLGLDAAMESGLDQTFIK